MHPKAALISVQTILFFQPQVIFTFTHTELPPSSRTSRTAAFISANLSSIGASTHRTHLRSERLPSTIVPQSHCKTTPVSTSTTMMSKSDPASGTPTKTREIDEEDPYLYLEEVESESSLSFAKNANSACLSTLGDPTTSSTGTYEKILNVLQSNERIPYVSSNYGKDKDGNIILMNLWKDKENVKGLWRKTTMSSYRNETGTEWETVLDIDKLAEAEGISWVWKGSSSLPRSLDLDGTNGPSTTRTLLRLSRGGADAVHLREFDFATQSFVGTEDGGFVLPEAKTSASYRSRDVLCVGSDFGPGSLTNSGYPRVIKEWVRGTKIEDAKVLFEGEVTDVSVSAYVSDQRHRGGPIYDVRSRSMTFYKRKRWVRRVEYGHLLPEEDEGRKGLGEAEEFRQVDVQEDAGVSFLGRRMMITLRSDWIPCGEDGEGARVYKAGSLLYVDADTFLTKSKESCTFNVLFEPTNTTALKTYTLTKNFLILFTMDNIKTKTLFYKIEADDNGGEMSFVGGDNEAKIQACSASSVDARESDEFWWSSSGYTQPSTLSLGDASLVTVTATATDATTDKPSYIVEQIKSLPEMYDASDLTVTQKFATSEDGTQIPYFLIAKKGTVLDGSTPTLLYGYGGFEISLGPKYIASVGVSWLERGGAFVEANIRGGGEFGPSWHQAGLKEKRHKCFEDFIAVAEHLIAGKICTPSTLAIRGGSNGGLLVGMMYVLRPDLFGAIHCAVPLLDMKRYHKLLAGASWMAEYGNPDEDWDTFLKNYSPYHLIDGAVERYPPMLVTTSTRDDRVHPGHSRKMVKKLWDIVATDAREVNDIKNKRDWPVYYYENIEGGHGGAADSRQSAFMTALAYDFMWETLCNGK